MVFLDAEWEDFNKNKEKLNYPKWPNETMLKIIFGNYLKNRININPRSKILDVGCGFGNNLLPFLDIKCQCFGTEVTKNMAKQTKRILGNRGYDVNIRCGKNKKLPFKSNFFDLLISINAIHYEKTENDIRSALNEYKRVLRKNGRIFLITVGPKHEIFRRAHPLNAHRYKIRNYDFRNGQTFCFFETVKYLKDCMNDFFNEVETGRVTEQLMSLKLDFFVGVGSV